MKLIYNKKEVNKMDNYLQKLNINENLKKEINSYRENYPVSHELLYRIPKPDNLYYGDEIWNQAVTALLCGENILLVGHKATGKNIFADDCDPNGLSQEAYYFIGGLMRHVKGMCAITNPLVNSYKRLVPGFEAPVYIAWSGTNRSPLIRIPAERGEGTRIELRCPDPSANPYLVLAVCLAAGLDGIQKQIMPPAAVDRNIFNMTEEEILEEGIDVLPNNLLEAVYEMEKDELVKEVLGTHTSRRYIKAKKKEWAEYSRQVSGWELDQYLYRI